MSNINPEGGLVPAIVQFVCPTSVPGVEVVVVDAFFENNFEEYLLECEQGLKEWEEFLLQPHTDDEGHRVAVDIFTDNRRWCPTLVAAEHNSHISLQNLPERLANLICPQPELLTS